MQDVDQDRDDVLDGIIALHCDTVEITRWTPLRIALTNGWTIAPVQIFAMLAELGIEHRHLPEFHQHPPSTFR